MLFYFISLHHLAECIKHNDKPMYQIKEMLVEKTSSNHSFPKLSKNFSIVNV